MTKEAIKDNANATEAGIFGVENDSGVAIQSLAGRMIPAPQFGFDVADWVGGISKGHGWYAARFIT